MLTGGVLQITRYLEATNLKYYFNINNSYVPNKLKVILCPILHKVSPCNLLSS